MTQHLKFYGFPEECARFEQRHPLWNEVMNNLARALNGAFTRVQVMDAAVEKIVYFFGRLCAEDFMEITLVCYHGYGGAALKLVRTMYEYTVTLHYLHEHPDEVDTFLKYHRVQQDKLIRRLVETFGEGVLPAELVQDWRRKADEVRDEFMIPVCDHPNPKRRLNHSWNKLDFVSMAEKTGEIGKLIVPGYFFPLRHAHPTFGGLTQRLEIVNDHMVFKQDSEPTMVDDALMTAHNCILDVLEVQRQHFNPVGLADATQICLRDFFRVWSPDPAHLNG